MAAAKSISLFFASLFFVCMLGVMMRAQEQAKDSSKSTVLGSGHGIDHVAIAVRTLKQRIKPTATFSALQSLQVESTRLGRATVVLT